MTEYARKVSGVCGQGTVKNVVLTDETGEVRLALWNQLAEMPLDLGQGILLTHVVAKEDRYNKGIFVSKQGNFRNVK